MRIIADHFRRYAHALRFAIGLHGAEKFHPIVKNKHYHISSGARASLPLPHDHFYTRHKYTKVASHANSGVYALEYAQETTTYSMH